MQTIQELAMSVATEMVAAGYTQNTAWELYIYALLPVVRLHETNGKTYLDADLTADYIRDLKARFYSGGMKRGYYYNRLRGIDKLTRMHETGKLMFEFPRKGSMYEMNGYYAGLLDEYIGSNEFHPNTRGDVIWVVRSFFAWLVLAGYENLKRVAAPEIQRYMVHCSGFMTSISIYNVQLYLRKLCAYLAERGLLENNYHALLSMRVARESKMYPAATHYDISTVLGTIDRSTLVGKRDYAIVLLGAVIGLRAIDIKNLKLSNIDWQNGEIKLVQSKTGNTNALPLTEDVGEAVKDYILHARPNTLDDSVFIRLYPPYVALYDAWSIGNIWDRYRHKAGLSRKAFDGKGFHSLRRSLGKNMVTAGVSVYDAAQTMGDADMRSVKKYIALDSEHLAECALDFTGIAPKGGDAS